MAFIRGFSRGSVSSSSTVTGTVAVGQIMTYTFYYAGDSKESVFKLWYNPPASTSVCENAISGI